MNQENIIEPISEAELREASLEAREILEPLTDEDRERFLRVLKTIFSFAESSGSNGADRLTTMSRRLIALAWTMSPDYFEDSPSLAGIAKTIDCTRSALSFYSAEVRRRFGIRNRCQDHGWNFKDKKEAKAA